MSWTKDLSKEPSTGERFPDWINCPSGAELDIELLSEFREFKPKKSRYKGDRYVADIKLHGFIGSPTASVRVQVDGEWTSEPQTPKVGEIYTLDFSSRPLQRSILTLFDLWDSDDEPTLKGRKFTVYRKAREDGRPTYEAKAFVDRTAQRESVAEKLQTVEFKEEWVAGVKFLKEVSKEWTAKKVKPILVSNFERDFSDDEVKRILLEVAQREGASFDGETLRF